MNWHNIPKTIVRDEKAALRRLQRQAKHGRSPGGGLIICGNPGIYYPGDFVELEKYENQKKE